MLTHSSSTEFHPEDSRTDPIRIFEQHLLAGFPPDLALDLALNELVVRAAEATHASAAALALARNDGMVCRAATGHLAPDLGVHLNIRDGLSGACVQTRQPQISVDTEFDPRVDPAVSRHRGIRSILVVPVFDLHDESKLTGVLEVFSVSPAAFVTYHQIMLEGFAEECARLRQAAIEPRQNVTAPWPGSQRFVEPESDSPESVLPELMEPEFEAAGFPPAAPPSYKNWTLLLGGLAIVAMVMVSFMIGSRIGWLSSVNPQAQVRPAQSEPAEPHAAPPVAVRPANHSSSKPALEKASRSAPASGNDELVVYEKGKVVFRMSPAPAQSGSSSSSQLRSDAVNAQPGSIVEASAATKIPASANVWISPTEAENRLLNRTEPQYPQAARTAHRSGDVVLEVQVGEDGSVSKIRTLSGDPVLAAAAADAVHNWRYQPYRWHDRPAQFQTDVTLSFVLPN